MSGTSDSNCFPNFGWWWLIVLALIIIQIESEYLIVLVLLLLTPITIPLGILAALIMRDPECVLMSVSPFILLSTSLYTLLKKIFGLPWRIVKAVYKWGLYFI